ncbi:MAG TPA: GNAT family N-acetyltransferase [Vicinamibacterales bacterium]|nr:GNAT family N-acetyltransferase [Vicinamibacterales bacterium]
METHISDAEVRILAPGDASVLNQVAPGVFDRPIDSRWTREFLTDPRHHLAVAIDATVVVGMASAVHYLHPDKPPELWINEVGVAATHRRTGLARRLLHTLFAHGRTLGCTQAWVLADESNAAARALYAGAGGRPAAEAAVMYEFPLADASPAEPPSR